MFSMKHDHESDSYNVTWLWIPLAKFSNIRDAHECATEAIEYEAVRDGEGNPLDIGGAHAFVTKWVEDMRNATEGVAEVIDLDPQTFFSNVPTDIKKMVQDRLDELRQEFNEELETEGPSEHTTELLTRLDELSGVLDFIEATEAAQRARDLVQRPRKPRLRIVEEER